MVPVTRRTVLISTGVGMAALAAPALAAIEAGPMLAVYDSRLPQTEIFARECAAKGIRLLDIAAEDARQWRGCRGGFCVAAGDRIIGMTGWSDWVLLRGVLYEQRRRVRSEERVEMGGRTLFAWEAA